MELQSPVYYVIVNEAGEPLSSTPVMYDPTEVDADYIARLAKLHQCTPRVARCKLVEIEPEKRR